MHPYIQAACVLVGAAALPWPTIMARVNSGVAAIKTLVAKPSKAAPAVPEDLRDSVFTAIKQASDGGRTDVAGAMLQALVLLIPKDEP